MRQKHKAKVIIDNKNDIEINTFQKKKNLTKLQRNKEETGKFKYKYHCCKKMQKWVTKLQNV